MKNHIISLRKVKVHNLKNINISFPTQEFIVLSGVSGSGKSSLAFDTIYTEGQRRYLESLSNYLKKQLGGLPKPEAESIEGITPTIAIEQKSVAKNPRSTVGTLTGIQDFLRILFSKTAIPYCPISKKPVKPQSIQEILKNILKLPKNSKWLLIAPFIKEKKGNFKEEFKELQKKGFIKIFIDDEVVDISENIELDKNVHHTINVVLDRFSIDPDKESRLLDSINQALDFSDQTFFLYSLETKEKLFFSTHAYSLESGVFYPPLESQDFSYNHPQGMCSKCQGLGQELDFDLTILIDKKKSIKDGCVAFMGSYDTVKWGNIYENLARIYKFSCNEPFDYFSEEQKKVLLYGTENKWTKMHFIHPIKKTEWTEFIQWKGIIFDLQSRYKEATSTSFKEELEKYMHKATCQSCFGSRLKPYPSAAKLHNKTFQEISELSLDNCLIFFSSILLNELEKTISQGLIDEITRRLRFLIEVGLDYLNLYRTSPTLSGGEAQRIRLASQIGSGLIGTTFVLDEPSIGLHPSDNKRLIKTLKQLKDQGNTVIVVEHDEETILAADRIIDVGPGAGIEGGEILSNGTIKDLLNTKNSLTGSFLRGELEIPYSKERRKPNNFLQIYNASLHNLKNIDVNIPLECFVAVTGLSGSGKSSLILGTLYPLISNILMKTDLPTGPHETVTGIDHLKKIIAIDQTPIGRTPRSNPATYVKIFDDIRELFASTKDAQSLGFQAGRFSFNVKEGSCPQCLGMGLLKLDMDFLEDEWTECPLCNGQRFDPQTLSIRYKNRSIFDILEMSVSQAREFFENIPHIEKKLTLLEHVGLGYIKLGQSSTTLSGGEAQRIKLAKELIRPSRGGTLYIFDEPTTGLHFADIKKLIDILQQLVKANNTVIVIEHNMDLIKAADYIIDLGPKGGTQGGMIIGLGTPEEIAKHQTATGIALKEILELNRKDRAKKLINSTFKNHSTDFLDKIKIVGASEHNLKNISLDIPRNKISVFTGPSGSGKSSLAFDTIYAEGQRRYVDSLPSYIKQFIDIMPKPHIDWIDGLSPAIALEQTKVLKNPRSTIGTMTETYDYLRILYSTEGVPYCPETKEKIKPITIEYIYNKLLKEHIGKKVIVLSPIKSNYFNSVDNLKKEMQQLGFIRLKLNNEYYEIDQDLPFYPKRKNSIYIVIDRFIVKEQNEKRIRESLEKAKELGKNELNLEIDGLEHFFNLSFVAESTGKSYPPITPKSFLFNSSEGMCPDCLGLGFQYGSQVFLKTNLLEFTGWEILFLFLKDYASKLLIRKLVKIFNSLDIDLDLKLKEMSPKMLQTFLKGDLSNSSSLQWMGLESSINLITKAGNKELKEFFQSQLHEELCLSCNGSRLNPLASHVELDGKTLKNITSLSIYDLIKFLNNLPSYKGVTTSEILIQLKTRLSFLQDIGLGYLSLDRSAPTLSGGELQRIRLSKQLGASLSGCLYVLDEPTIGLHPHNNHLLNSALIKLKDLNNTIILVEHDPMTIAIADYIVDFGPEAGKRGGYIIAQGSYDEIKKNSNSITGKYLNKELELPLLKYKNKKTGILNFINAKKNNLKNVSFSIPLGKLTCITGVSGSGKSTLLFDIIYKNLEQNIDQTNLSFQNIEKIEGIDGLEKIYLMEQGSLGQTSRSDISTYTDILTCLRTFFSSLKESKTRGLQPKNFSFNHPKGMCLSCSGLGYNILDVKFMSPIKTTCPDCLGFRLNPLSLKVKYNNKHLGELLQLSVDDLEKELPPISKVIKIIDSLKKVGLGYLSLSQELNTLSGGEAQRLKLSRELVKSNGIKTIFLLDEPSTGLHFKDLSLLIKAIEHLLNKGCTIIMVEHNLDLIKISDHILDLGPDAGNLGGQILYEGDLKGLIHCENSYTSTYLKNHML